MIIITVLHSVRRTGGISDLMNLSMLFANNLCRSACEMFHTYAVIAVFKSLSVRGRSRYTADFAGVRSGERGDHKFVEMTRSPKISFRSFVEFFFFIVEKIL
jgi:hypothetical protein